MAEDTFTTKLLKSSVREGETYSGDELVQFLGGEEKVNDRLIAIGNDELLILAADEGNDNYKVLHIFPKKGE